MSEQVDYAALSKLANHLTGNQQMALGDIMRYLGFVVFSYSLTNEDVRLIIETLLDTQVALEGILPEKVNMK